MNFIFITIGLILLALGLIGFVANLKMRKVLEKKIAMLKEGDSAIIHGKVLGEKTILSAITQTPCVYAVFRTFQRGTRFGKIGETARGTAQVVLGSGAKHCEFVLEDETGKINVSDSQALVYGGGIKKEQYYDDDEKYKDKIVLFKSTTGIGEGENREYEEELVCPGDEIWVQGKFSKGFFNPSLFTLKDFKKITENGTSTIKEIAPIVIGIILIGVGLL